MENKITAINMAGGGRSIAIDVYPDVCPMCHYSITPLHISAYFNEKRWQESDCLQTINRCPRLECKQLFMANYTAKNMHCLEFEFKNFAPFKKNEKEFSETIKDISKNFCLIYNQSSAAEQEGLTEICGVGYRKAIEFIIKDYLIKLNPENEDKIKKKPLANCIKDDVENENIKEVAKRATWLGNDETHYFRKWEGKDLSDLKKLIDLTVHWLEMDKLTKDVIADMPDGE